MSDARDDPRVAPAWAIVDELLAFAREVGRTPASLAMAFALANPRVATILFGATRPEQIDENLAAVLVLQELSPGDLERLRAIGA